MAEENEPFLPKSTTPNPKFRKPVTNTGVGDFPGGDVLITLGAFLDTDNDHADRPPARRSCRGSTLMHELGTTAKRHGGEPDEPNCKPPYLSVMNYLYQLRGLLDDGGKPHWGSPAAAHREPSTRTTWTMARWASSRIGSVGTCR